MNIRKILATVSIAASIAMGGAATAEATPPNQTAPGASTMGLCDSTPNTYRITNAVESFTPADGQMSYTIEPGFSASVAIGTQVSASGSVGGSATAEAGILFASASATVSATLTAGIATTTTVTIQSPVVTTRTTFQLGFISTSFRWTLVETDNFCNETTIGGGTAVGLQNSMTFKVIS